MHALKISLASIAALVVAASFPAALCAQQPKGETAQMKATAPGSVAVANAVVVTAKVEAIDPATRAITLKGPEGNSTTITAGPEVKNFAQIKVGDTVAVRYVEALMLELKKGGAGVRERVETKLSDKAKPGERPAAVEGREIKVTADVVAVNTAKKTVTLRGPKRTVDLKVNDPAQLKLIKVGDQVEATYTEAAAISVEPAK